MAEWTVDLKDYADGEKARIKAVRKRFVWNLYAAIVKKTPVDTGRARGNWNVSAGAPDGSTNEDGTERRYRQGRSLPDADGDEPYFISNNLPYIEKLEYGGYPNPPKGGKGKTVNGYSKQAPHGMVGATLANSKALFKNAVDWTHERGRDV